MPKYLFIESRDPFENRSTEGFLEMARKIANNGDTVTLFFIQNGVLPLRKATQYSNKILELIENKVDVRADEFSLLERGIQDHERLRGVAVSGVEQLVEHILQPGVKTIWH